MPIFNLSALLYQLENNQLKDFDSFHFKKITTITAGQDLHLSGGLLAAVIMPNGNLGCLTEKSFQVFDVANNQCLKEFVIPFSPHEHPRMAVSRLSVLPGGDNVLISRVSRYATHGSYNENVSGKYEIWNLTTGQCILKGDGSPQLVIDNGSILELHMDSGVWAYSGDQSVAAFNPVEANLNKRSPSALIKTIQLNFNALTQQDVLPLLEAMCNFPHTVRNLSLKGMKLDEKGFEKIMILIKNHTKFKSLNLQETLLTYEQEAIIRQLWMEKGFCVENLLFSPNIPAERYLSISEILTTTFVLQDKQVSIEAPERFFCPITHEMMFNPVMAFDGYTYEEEAIQEQFLLKQISPMTNAELPNSTLIPNLVLRSEICEFLEKNPEHWEQVYLPKGWHQQINAACQTTHFSSLEELIHRDRRLLTYRIMTNQTQLIFEWLCEQREIAGWAKLFQLFVNKLKFEEWKMLFTGKSIREWLKCIANAHVSQLDKSIAASCFLIGMQHCLGKLITPFELGLYALQHQDEALFNLSFIILNDINQQDTMGNTFLHLVAENLDTPATRQIIKQLIVHGANIEIKNQHDQTADMIAENKKLPLLAIFIREESKKQLIKTCLQENEKTSSAVLSSILNKVAELEAKVAAQQSLIIRQQAALDEAAQQKAVQASNDSLSLIEEKRTQLKTILADSSVRKKLYSDKKPYLRGIFSAISPEFSQIDKETLREIAREEENRARIAFLKLQELLVEACLRGDINRVKQLHQQGADLEQPDSQGRYPFSAACEVVAESAIDYITAASSKPEELWMRVGCDAHIMQTWNEKKLDNRIPRISEQTSYAALDEILTGTVASRCNKMQEIHILISAWDKAWVDGGGVTYLQQRNDLQGPLKTLSQRNTSYGCFSDSSFSGSSTQRYYGSEIRAKKEQLITFVNQCLNEIEYISEKIHLYQRHIEQLQRISFSRTTM